MDPFSGGRRSDQYFRRLAALCRVAGSGARRLESASLCRLEVGTRDGPDVGSLGPSDHQPMARTVLIVDDHAPFRAVARALLPLEGFAVVGDSRCSGSCSSSSRSMSAA